MSNSPVDRSRPHYVARPTRPWTVREHPESFEVVAGNGLRLAFIYFEDEPTRASSQRRLCKADAERLAHEITRLPALLRIERGLDPDAE